MSVLEQYSDLKTIIDYGRWAPSGDNTQPWRFKILDNEHFDILGFDLRDHCVYDLQGHASQLALGILLENLAIGAATIKKTISYQLDPQCSDEKPLIHVSLIPSNQPDSAHLAPCIPIRSVNRRALSTQKITRHDKQQLEKSVQPLKILWFEGKEKLKTTRLFFDSAGIRLTIPEAFATHSSIIEWNSQFSRDKMPDQCLGSSWITTKLMKFALQDWNRVHFLNRFLAGTWLPRIEMDIIPGLFSGAHFILCRDKPAKTIEDYLESGRLVQRFWLNATEAGIQLQPQTTAMIFSQYYTQNISFTTDKKSIRASERLKNKLAELISPDYSIDQVIFIGRIGYGKPAQSRSIRLTLDDLTRVDLNRDDLTE